MTNREYYKDRILDIACNGGSIAVDKTTHLLHNCRSSKEEESFPCCECLFFIYDGDCDDQCKNWCNQEHIEKPKLTKNEKLFLSLLQEKWKYIARDMDDSLLLYASKPIKHIDIWGVYDSDGTNIDTLSIDTLLLDDCEFAMVKWKDEEPWLIEDLKKLPVEEEN